MLNSDISQPSIETFCGNQPDSPSAIRFFVIFKNNEIRKKRHTDMTPINKNDTLKILDLIENSYLNGV